MSAKVVLDSVNTAGERITTLQLKYPRFIHSEFMTHRVFSRNASSSRAIPVAKMIEQVSTDPAMPVHWGRNQPGMQARAELEPMEVLRARALWVEAARKAVAVAEVMAALGLHKQVINRILEPFQYMHVVVTATDWDNFFKLRIHPDAEPNIQVLAREMRHALDTSKPRRTIYHLPYMLPDEENLDMVAATMISAARCARVSYLNHDGTAPDANKDMELARTLKEAGHASPFEHVALAAPGRRVANFTGWQSLRNSLGI